MAQQIIKEERNARNFLKEHNGLLLSDKVWRAYGTLANARYMSSREALELISLVRLGYNLGYFNQLTLAQIDQMYLTAQPGYLQVLHGKAMNDGERVQNVPRSFKEEGQQVLKLIDNENGTYDLIVKKVEE